MTHGTYNPLLVTVSILIATFASYTALDIGNRVSATRGRARGLWLFGGSLALGVGIWSMHFIGMLAFSMPGMRVAYDIPLLVLSIVVAVGASAVALAVISRPEVSPAGFTAAGLAVATAICGMHYIGIFAMHMPARIAWNSGYVVASFAIALGAAYAALGLALRFRHHQGQYALRSGAGLLMGIAISGMHYTGMAAMRFSPAAAPMVVSNRDLLASGTLAAIVIFGTLLILSVALISSIAQRELQRQTVLTRESERLFREAASRAAEEETLRRATEEMAAAISSDDVLERIAVSIVEATASDGAFVEKIDGSSGGVTVAITVGASQRQPERSVAFANSFSARVAGQRQPLLLTHGDRLTLGPPFNAMDAPGSVMVVPLMDDADPLGALVLWRRAGRQPYVPGEAIRTHTLANVASLAARRILLIEEADQRRDQLEIAERFAALGRVASTTAHEFNNVLMSIQAFHEVARRAGTFEAYVKNSPQIERAIQRGKRVTDSVLRLTRASQPSLGTVDLTRWLSELRPDLSALMPGNVVVGITAEPGLFASADVSHLEQVLINLALNARDAMPDGGRLVIHASSESDRIHITVRDTGPGMQEQMLTRIFEPLFTTRASGTGLGLAIVHEIVRAHGGTISVESRVGEGTEFHIFLEAASPSAAAERQPQPESKTLIERILLVEDDDIVAEGLTLVLEMSGFSVRRVDLGRDAVPTIAEFHPDVVVLDVGLPDMDGVAVYHLIESQHPGMPVVFATGHADETLLASIIEYPNVGFLRKPFDGETLTSAIERAFAGSLTSVPIQSTA